MRGPYPLEDDGPSDGVLLDASFHVDVEPVDDGVRDGLERGPHEGRVQEVEQEPRPRKKCPLDAPEDGDVVGRVRRSSRRT